MRTAQLCLYRLVALMMILLAAETKGEWRTLFYLLFAVILTVLEELVRGLKK